ncbi:MAG TPA: minor capsid protein [Caproiciproducens sp.]|nr:minor capsid protein [Caproiciproducens sp.]
MLTLEQVRDWLKSQDADLNGCIAVGSIDGNKDKFVGVYPLKPSGSSQRICIGGADQTRYQERSVSILVHWTNKMSTAEAKATAIYGLFYGLSGVKMGETRVISTDPGPAPIPVGKDSHGICEYVIQLKTLYERT